MYHENSFQVRATYENTDGKERGHTTSQHGTYLEAFNACLYITQLETYVDADMYDLQEDVRIEYWYKRPTDLLWIRGVDLEQHRIEPRFTDPNASAYEICDIGGGRNFIVRQREPKRIMHHTTDRGRAHAVLTALEKERTRDQDGV